MTSDEIRELVVGVPDTYPQNMDFLLKTPPERAEILLRQHGLLLKEIAFQLAILNERGISTVPPDMDPR